MTAKCLAEVGGAIKYHLYVGSLESDRTNAYLTLSNIIGVKLDRSGG
jgi:hypothetical protein